MDTKQGLILLIGGSYLMALAIAGINANSGWAQAFWSVMLVVGIVLTGWSVVLPWDGGRVSSEARE
jgi:hypothetical protein